MDEPNQKTNSPRHLRPTQLIVLRYSADRHTTILGLSIQYFSHKVLYLESRNKSAANFFTRVQDKNSSLVENVNSETR